MLDNVTPRPTMHHVRDSLGRYPKVSSDFGDRDALDPRSTNASYEVVIQDCEVMVFSMNVPPFRDHVLDVFGVGSEKHVIGAHARRVVAAVTDLKTAGNRAIRPFPQHAMSHRLVAMRSSKYPVSRCRFPASPHPAVAGLVDLRPETIFGREVVSHQRGIGLNVTVTLPSPIVSVAPRIGPKRFITHPDRACFHKMMISHPVPNIIDLPVPAIPTQWQVGGIV